MFFGMPNLVECADIYECISVAKNYGLDFLEINLSFPDYYPTSIDIPRLKRTMKEQRIFCTVHADEELNPFTFDSTVSRAYFDVMSSTIDFAKEIDAKVINIHLQKGVYVTLPDKVIFLSDVYREKYLSAVKSFISMCEKMLSGSDIIIAIENVDTTPFTNSQIEALELFMESDVFALTLDVGHDACMGGKDRRVFEKYKEKLLHMHLHDSDYSHAHLSLGSGKVDIVGVLSMLPTDRCALIEVKTLKALQESIKYLKENSIMR